MIVRGAPAIGQVGAIGLTLTADKARTTRPYARRATLRGAAKTLINARPTAVNLRWAVERVMAAYEAVGDLSEDGDAIADAMRAEADTIVFETTEDHGRLATFGLEELTFPEDRPLRILTHCNTGPAGVRPVRDRPRRRPGGPPRRARRARLGRRDPAVPAGRAADRLGAGPGRRAAHADPGRGRRSPDGERRGGRHPRRGRPDRRQRRHRQQGRDLHAGRAGGSPRHPVLRRGTDQHGGPRHARRRVDPDRGAQGERGPVRARREHRPAGHRGPQSRLRRDPVRPHHRHRQRRGRDPGPVPGGPRRGRRPPRAAAQVGAGVRGRVGGGGRARRVESRRPRRDEPRRPRRPPRSSPDGHHRDRPPPGRHRPPDDRSRACSTRSSSRTGCTRPMRSATSRSASSRARAGAPRTTATS